MEKEVKRVFNPKPISARKLSIYLLRAKLYPKERAVRSYKCDVKRCEVCINVDETSTFTSTVTRETYMINHRFDCTENVRSTFWPVINVKCIMLGRLLMSSCQDGTTTKESLESMIRRLHACNNICLTIFVPLAIAVSYRMSHWLL